MLYSADGPQANVLKFKSPMCFNKENADELVQKLDQVFTEIEEIRTKNGPLGKGSILAYENDTIDPSGAKKCKKTKIAAAGEVPRPHRDH